MSIAYQYLSDYDSESRHEPVDRRTGLSVEEFEREYLYPNKPVILQDATEDWIALEKWSPDWLKQRYHSLPVIVDDEWLRFGDFIDRVLAPVPGERMPYLRNQSMQMAYPDLMADIQPIPKYCWPNWLHGRYAPEELAEYMRVLTTIELFIGGRGSRFPRLHIDSARTHAFLNQVYGAKDLVFISPAQANLVYPNRKGVSMIEDVDYPDLQKYPLFADAEPIRVTIRAGETAFVPSGWWHTARMPGPSITVAVNTANASNWRDLVNDIAGQRQGLAGKGMAVYLTVMGVWNRLARVGRASAARRQHGDEASIPYHGLKAGRHGFGRPS
jgi:hypothetical protein